MKGLSQFLMFDWDGFAKDKAFVCTGVSEYSDYNTGAHIGSRVEAIISVDKTAYDFRNGQSFTNKFEKIVFKVTKDVNIPIEARIQPRGVVAKVYGDYHNLLSITCSDIAVATSTPSASAQVKKEI